MQLLVIRHARAGTARDFARSGADDELRPLTPDGVARMRTAAAGLRRLVPEIDVLASSPLVRARQTADILAAELAVPTLIEIDTLRPGSPPTELLDWLRDAGARETVAVVGHDSYLSELVGLLLTGEADPLLKIRKGGAVMLKLRRRKRNKRLAGHATLLWAMTPRQLRMLGAGVSSRASG